MEIKKYAKKKIISCIVGMLLIIAVIYGISRYYDSRTAADHHDAVQSVQQIERYNQSARNDINNARSKIESAESIIDSGQADVDTAKQHVGTLQQSADSRQERIDECQQLVDESRRNIDEAKRILADIENTDKRTRK